jgi:hypothetical protein
LLGAGDVAVQETLVSGTNIKTLNSVSLLGAGNIVLAATPSGVAGAIQFSDGSAFSSDATKFFWDNTNKRLGIGTNLPTQALDVVGQGRFSDNILFTTDAKFIGRDINSSSFRFTSASNEIRANISTGGQFQIYNSGTGTARLSVSSGGQTTISGSGSTSATTSLLVQNSAASTSLQLTDDGRLNLPSTGASSRTIVIGGGYIGFRGDTNKLLGIEAGGFVYYDGTNRFQVGNTGDAIVYGELNMNSTTKGFLPPRMTTTQRNAIASPAAGLVVYDSTTNKLQCYNGSTWNDLF